MLIDTHCHLTDERFTEVKETLRQAREAGVEKVIIPSTSLADAKKAVEVAERERQYCLVGIHPEEVENLMDSRLRENDVDMKSGSGDLQGLSSQEYLQGKSLGRDGNRLDGAMEEMKKIIKSSKRVVGVGEIGLDFYWDKEKKTEEKQVKLFRKQMELAVENDLPVAIHMREAEEEMKKELELFMNIHGIENGHQQGVSSQDYLQGNSLGEGSGKHKLRGQFHCFAGSREFLEMILAKGYYVSFGGNITYKSAGNLREILKEVPLDRLLLETDSPYLPPEPLRGTINTPANVKIVAEFVASELNLNLKQLAEITSQNTKCLYSLEN